MAMVAVRSGCVCVWVGGGRGVRRYFQHNRGGVRTNFSCFGGGVTV